ncbi:chromosome partitioning protein [Rhodoferax ferrireducens]|uniref:Chromosome partitioning protein n=1 Tax=Rhodoferax ferrireducens TaxID=192843 RepID=A0ABU2CD16_9BURK|nr:ParA family protein [Rhodoferax ferrireducens]MDR7379223.1 chromosome partitioning protein [Rhodoferax ferrireducens]
MPIVVVASPKGGVGKSTLSTQIAGYYASRGHHVVLGDADPQQSSGLWLSLRPTSAAPIGAWDVEADEIDKPPKAGKDTTYAVLDTPAGLEGKRFKDVMKLADKIIVPLQPSVFDIFATRKFLDRLAEHRRIDKMQVGLVGMRVDERTLAAERLHDYLEGLELPVLTYLRNTQNYVHLAASGLSLFDVHTSRVEKDLEQWQPLSAWLDA